MTTPSADQHVNQMAFVVVIAKTIFLILDTFFASSGELQPEEEFPERSAQHQMKTR